MNKNKPQARNENIVVQELEKELLIYDLTINKAFCLNETSAMIYNLCDGQKTVAEMSNLLAKKLNQPITEDLIWLALDNFKKDNLLEESEQFEIDFNGLSRRQMVKKIGLASMIALPVMASVTAPVAGATASDPRNCYSSVIGVCMMAGVQACPASCPAGTQLMLTLYNSMDGTCSGGVGGSGSSICPSGLLVLDYTIDNF